MNFFVVCAAALAFASVIDADIVIKSSSEINNTEVKDIYIQILRGRDGRDGLTGRDGQKGERGDKGIKGESGPVGPAGPKSGGVVYTRWGRTSCPTDTGAELLYEGIAGGSKWDQPGGGANYICLPKVPHYVSTHIPSLDGSYMYGSEYRSVNGIFPGKNYHNVPCAVCYTAKKSVKLMIPGRITCPSTWTIEYKGYLMAERYNHARNTVYECVDENVESLAGSDDTSNEVTVLYFIHSTCNGLPCPPYVDKRVLTCVVCTK
uniref:Short-chain collagen C4-like n=1 Tax=Amphimedon queenslandica TaxID=400682 RepID=A0A1X7TGB1_AMPQE